MTSVYCSTAGDPWLQMAHVFMMKFKPTRPLQNLFMLSFPKLDFRSTLNFDDWFLGEICIFHQISLQRFWVLLHIRNSTLTRKRTKTEKDLLKRRKNYRQKRQLVHFPLEKCQFLEWCHSQSSVLCTLVLSLSTLGKDLDAIFWSHDSSGGSTHFVAGIQFQGKPAIDHTSL